MEQRWKKSEKKKERESEIGKERERKIELKWEEFGQKTKEKLKKTKRKENIDSLQSLHQKTVDQGEKGALRKVRFSF